MELLDKVNAALVVANDISRISGDYHEALIVDRMGNVHEFKGTKERLAIKILDVLEDLL